MVIRKSLAVVGACVVGLGALSACSSGEEGSKGASAQGDDALKVVATTTQICDYVTQLAAGDTSAPTKGSEKAPAAESEIALEKTDSQGTTQSLGASKENAKATVNLTCLLAPNASAHEHEMTPQQMDALGQADLFLTNGVDLEHFLDSAVESSGFRGTMVATSGLRTSVEKTDPEKAKKDAEGLAYTASDGKEHVDVQKWPFPPEEGEGEGESFVFDPHVWTAPKNAIIQVRNIGDAMATVNPDLADIINAHVDQYVKRLEDLDKWAKDSFESVPKENRTLFTSHDAFGYFSKEFDINFIGAALSDFSGQQDATADHIASAAQEVKDSGAKALFAENSNNSKSIESIARAAGVRAVIGDDALYGDSLGPAGSDGETYIGSQLHNIINLVKAWGGTPAEIPASLSGDTPEDIID